MAASLSLQQDLWLSLLNHLVNPGLSSVDGVGIVRGRGWLVTLCYFCHLQRFHPLSSTFP
jgi:hypothetical protein